MRFKKKITEGKFFLPKAQAIAELAIFGSLIITVFGALLTYAQRMENSQRIKMETFRRALQAAYYNNSAVSYSLKKDDELVNLSPVYEPTTRSGSSTVMWQRGNGGQPNTEGEAFYNYYQINDSAPTVYEPEIDKTVYTKTGADQDVKVPRTPWKERKIRDTRYSSTITKQETAAGITNIRHAELDQNSTLTFSMRASTQCQDKDGNIEDCDARDDPDDVIPAYTYTFSDSDDEVGEATDHTTWWRDRVWQTNH